MVLERKLSKNNNMNRYIEPHVEIRVIRHKILCSSIKFESGEAQPDVPVLARKRDSSDKSRSSLSF